MPTSLSWEVWNWSFQSVPPCPLRPSLTTTHPRQLKELRTDPRRFGCDRARYQRDLRVDAEILHGLARLPEGRRKQALQQGWDVLTAELLAGRILPFTSEEAHWYAELVSRRERMGRPMATADAVIAATALAHGAALASRDLADFSDIAWS
ncbi:MAG: PIN domain-containing protein [Synechococcaceae cyanobacterium]